MREEDYARRLNAQPDGDDLAHVGAKLFVSQGCSGCHSASSGVHAPKLEGLHGRTLQLCDGRQVRANDAYTLADVLTRTGKI